MTPSIALIGPGLVGSEFLSQIQQHAQRKLAGALPLNVVAIMSSSKLLLGPVSLDSWSEQLKQCANPASLRAFEDCAESQPEGCIIVDCTSSEDVAQRYPAWLARGIHVVTPNKKAFSGDIGLYDEIKALTAPKLGVKVPYALHESTVGAGLPILSTLNDMVDTGDQIIKIEGILSGTLSFIFNNFSTTNGSHVRFSDIVKEAKELGYTEPDPRDDLNGMDVARKVVILGRLAGVQNLSLENLTIENVVPKALRSVESSTEFMSRLHEYDSEFSKLNNEAREKGDVLRCVGIVDVVKGEGAVKLVGYPASHPFASMKGSDNIVAFTTKRFPNPLIIQGAGAGAAVTAFGMFSDVLKIIKSR